MSSTVVNTNVMALNSHRALKGVGTLQSKASARLSSGMKVNSAADDAAGLAISEKMRAQIRGLDMASKNSQDAISLVQIADGGLAEISNMMQRIRELAVQAANETNEKGNDKDTGKLKAEASHLVTEITEMAKRTQFNKIDLLKQATTLTMQVGANSGQTMAVRLKKIDASALCVNAAHTTIGTGGTAASALLSNIDNGLGILAEERAKLGAYQNRLEYTIKSLDIASENTSAAESRVRDADMAKEMMNMSKANVLQQASVAMLSQANQAPQNILPLLR